MLVLRKALEMFRSVVIAHKDLIVGNLGAKTIAAKKSVNAAIL